MIEIAPMQTLYAIYDRYQYIIRLVVGGEKNYYVINTGSLAVSMLETKILFNSVISDPKEGYRFMSCHLKKYLCTTIDTS